MGRTRAIETLRTVVRERPDLTVAYDRLAFFLRASGRVADAVAVLDEAARSGHADAACARSAIQKAYMMPAECRNRKAVRYLAGSQIGSRVGVARAQNKHTRGQRGCGLAFRLEVCAPPCFEHELLQVGIHRAAR